MLIISFFFFPAGCLVHYSHTGAMIGELPVHFRQHCFSDPCHGDACGTRSLAGNASLRTLSTVVLGAGIACRRRCSCLFFWYTIDLVALGGGRLLTAWSPPPHRRPARNGSPTGGQACCQNAAGNRARTALGGAITSFALRWSWVRSLWAHQD